MQCLLIFLIIVLVSAPTALSSDRPGEEDVLDAGCLLEVLRLYRWHISSFEEQVGQKCCEEDIPVYNIWCCVLLKP